MSSSDDSIENVDFGGKFARQFFKNNWPNSEGDPFSSTPVASDHSVCDSGHESFVQTPFVQLQAQQSRADHRQRSHSSQQLTPQPLQIKLDQQLANQQQSSPSQTPIKHQISPQLPPQTQLSPLQPLQQMLTPQSHHHHSLQHHHHHHHHDQHNNSDGDINNNTIPAIRLALKQETPTTSTTIGASAGAINPWAVLDAYRRFNIVDKIERAASLHRMAASYSEPQYTWSGQLPSRSYKNPVLSCKVFLGGVPWDITEQGLIDTFGRFGPLRVQWPGKDVRQQSGQTKAGYVYLIYESERFVRALLQACTKDYGAGSHPEKYYYQLSSRRMRFKEVQVIPWILADSNYIRNQSGRQDMHRTVFVGALHGMLTAEGLAKIMNDLFGGVAYVGIDSDKYKYPIGSGRVTFYNQKSYMKAVSAAFIEVKSSQFCKKIQVDPYLELSECSTCHIQNGPIFCRDCLRYFCKTCWNWHHSVESLLGRQHRPLMRKKRET